MTGTNSFGTICAYLPADIRGAMAKLDRRMTERLTEVRLYCGRGVALFERDSVRYLVGNGMTSERLSAVTVKVTAEHMKQVVSALCRYSFHSHEAELTDGWFVLENGVRAGVCGIFSHGGKGTVREASSVNFRVAREVKGCADGIADRCFGKSILICGAVNSGKTTLLRDLCRQYGSRVRCTLVDERNEISAVKNGVPTFDVGALTDVVVGRSRSDGIIGAVRTMSPMYIFCDETAAESDFSAIEAAMGCGTKFAATIHADSFNDLMKRKAAERILRAFDVAVFLSGTTVSEVRKLWS